jgi:hypothetical protein
MLALKSWNKAGMGLACVVVIVIASACSLSGGGSATLAPTDAPAESTQSAVQPPATATEEPATATSVPVTPTDEPATATPQTPTDAPATSTEAEAGTSSEAEVATATDANAASVVVVEITAQAGLTCSVSPSGAPVDVHSGPNASFPVVASLTSGDQAVARWLDRSGAWYRLRAPGSSADAGWVSADAVTLQQPCTCTTDACTAESS